MSALAEINKCIEGIGTRFDEFQKTNDARIKALQEGKDSLAAEFDQKLEKINVEMNKLSELKTRAEAEMDLQRERIEELEARAKEPIRTPAQKHQEEYKSLFLDWMRHKGQSPLHEQKMQDLRSKMAQESKSVTIGSAAGGGHAVPEEIAREIERLELLFSPVRRLIKVVRAGSSDYKELVNIRGTSSGWVGESDSRTETNTPQLREVAPTFGELYAYPQASEWSLDDIFFNVEAWLAEEVAQEFALQEGTAVISGNGTSKPTGMLNTTPVATDDFASPLRAAAAYQFISSTTASSPAVGEVKPDSLIDLVYKVRSPYRMRATFVMNSATTGAVRKLKDSQNQYLWAPGLAAGQPNNLLGFPVETWEQMQDVALNNFPIAFGDFRRAYVLADRVGLRITRDNVTNVGFVRFYIRRREGGIVLNNDAIKFLKTD